MRIVFRSDDASVSVGGTYTRASRRIFGGGTPTPSVARAIAGCERCGNIAIGTIPYKRPIPRLVSLASRRQGGMHPASNATAAARLAWDAPAFSLDSCGAGALCEPYGTAPFAGAGPCSA